MLDADTIRTLSVPGVLSARRGFRIADNWVSDEPSMVVKVRPGMMDHVEANVPHVIEGLPVDFRQASKLDLMATDHPSAFTALANARPELERTSFPDEARFTPDGEPFAIGGDAELMEFAARPAKPEIQYTPAAVALDPVDEQMTLILHASPDAGWAQLSNFLAGAAPNLVVGMYDFTSRHVLNAVEAGIGGGRMTLTLDHPPRDPHADQTDEESVDELTARMTNRLEQAWALTDKSPKAAAWIYPHSYHIKVAVRDDDCFWLSSGNWNNANQPIIDLNDEPAAKAVAKNSDRDWHVVATNKTLADLFRAYLQHDYDVAKVHQQAASALAGLDAEIAENAELAALLDDGGVPLPPREFVRFFQPKTINRKLKIQPLLTPDNYQPKILALIKSATQRFYMQTQYMYPGKNAEQADHDKLIEAVQERIDAGVDVRLICSQWESADNIEGLTKLGLTTKGIMRLQNKVHNKGIIVDSKIVVVSSQNWSGEGTLLNRDAGLIIYDNEAAAYYEEIFLHDWEHVAVDQLPAIA